MFTPFSLVKYAVTFYKNYFGYTTLLLIQTIISLLIFYTVFITRGAENIFYNFLIVYYFWNLNNLIFTKSSLVNISVAYGDTQLKTYLYVLYITLGNVSYGYLVKLFQHQVNIIKYIVIQITQILSLFVNMQNLWYPLFKKYSYFGYSRFTKFSQNRFLKNKNK